jgi:hypothetical protein
MFILMASRQQILGVKFFNGDAADAVEHISRHGGSVAAQEPGKVT